MDFVQIKLKILAYIKAYGEISSSEAQAITAAHRNTISGDFKQLLQEKLINTSGVDKGTRYTSQESIIL